ncbi:MAG TPA: SMP-30/gluconolactonase/LRE family protein, partial [Chitinophagaceae bacterium]|nr:SMP-30/gluconolactonase/LRE family protein [Chitinophagaceae bacterium]
MQKLFFLLLLAISTTTCFSQSTVAFTIPEKDLIPEGICYDAANKRFYVSSILKNKIVQVSDGIVSDFITSDRDGFIGGVGLHVDARRNILWACTFNAIHDVPRTGIFAFDIHSGKTIKKAFYPQDSIKHLFNDLTIADDGTIFITDSYDGSIYEWNASQETPRRLKLPHALPGLNGIVISPDNKYLFVAADTGIARIDLTFYTIRMLAKPGMAYSSRGLDGLVFYKNSLIGVQNGPPPGEKPKIIRYYLSGDLGDIQKAALIEEGNKFFQVPTTAAVVGDELYVIANSQLDNVDQREMKIIHPEKLTETFILKYKLR